MKISIRKFKIIYENSWKQIDWYLFLLPGSPTGLRICLKNAVLKSAFSRHLSYIWNSSDGIRETDVPV